MASLAAMVQENQVSQNAVTLCTLQIIPRAPTHGDKALLRAIATKIIPGLPESVRIAILQQTVSGDDGNASKVSLTSRADTSDLMIMNPLQYILESDTARNDIQTQLNGE